MFERERRSSSGSVARVPREVPSLSLYSLITDPFRSVCLTAQKLVGLLLPLLRLRGSALLFSNSFIVPPSFPLLLFLLPLGEGNLLRERGSHVSSLASKYAHTLELKVCEGEDEEEGGKRGQGSQVRREGGKWQ